MQSRDVRVREAEQEAGGVHDVRLFSADATEMFHLKTLKSLCSFCIYILSVQNNIFHAPIRAQEVPWGGNNFVCDCDIVYVAIICCEVVGSVVLSKLN